VNLEPSAPILERFGVRVLEDWGGQRNRHWLVARGAERLVLRRWDVAGANLEWEINLLERVHALGWPVARALEMVADERGTAWSLHPHLRGEPATDKNSLREQSTRGRLLAEFHRSLETLNDLPQRPGWRRGEDILADQTLETTFEAHPDAKEARVFLWHLESARALIAPLEPALRPSQVVHGDFTPWNLLFDGRRLSGILDFELAHTDHRIADFALAWRGSYDDVIRAYEEVSPLEDEERALLTPLWWAYLLEGAAKYIRDGVRDDGWTLKMLRRRSSLMIVDAPMHGST
jgi:Ser/Thr protein kinase RdoA (MazF antagonist)